MKEGSQALLIFGICAALTCGDAQAGSQYSLGVEGFKDNYREPDLDLSNHAKYGSLTGYYNYEWTGALIGLDGRASYGTNDYESPSGTLSNVPEWEFELRERVGAKLLFWDNVLTPYIGLGQRYFIDENKGEVTNLDKFGYDRRIFQLYLPIGLTYTYVTADKWTIAPTIEYDRLLYGNVNSRLQNIGGYNVVNHQSNGYGIRGEFMIGQTYNSFSWQAGPFVRYWNIRDSDVIHTPDLPPNMGWEEPNNIRTQVGLALRVAW